MREGGAVAVERSGATVGAQRERGGGHERSGSHASDEQQ